MNRVSAFLICLLVCGVAFLHNSAEAEEINLQDGWYASVTNIQFLIGYDTPEVPLHWQNSPFGGWFSSQSSPHITVQTGSETADWVNFSMTSGSVTLGQEDAYVEVMALSNYYHAVQFDWTTNWTDPHAAQHLRLEVWGERGNWPWTGPEGYYLFDYFYPGAGLKTSHATMWTHGTYSIELHLVPSPVPSPEPSSLLALFCGLAGLGGILFRRRRK